MKSRARTVLRTLGFAGLIATAGAVLQIYSSTPCVADDSKNNNKDAVKIAREDCEDRCQASFDRCANLAQGDRDSRKTCDNSQTKCAHVCQLYHPEDDSPGDKGQGQN